MFQSASGKQSTKKGSLSGFGEQQIHSGKRLLQ
jgi:hypothetical protein